MKSFAEVYPLFCRRNPIGRYAGEAADGREAAERTRELRPDIVIIDIGMPGLNGLEATRQIVKNNPHCQVLVLTLHDCDQVVREVLNAGAHGFLLKSDAARDLVAAVEALSRGKTFTSRVAAMVLHEGTTAKSALPQRERLTHREREVIQLIAEGKSTKEVAVTLGLSVKTAETHRSNLLQKLDLHCTSDLVMYAVRNNIVQVVQATWGEHDQQTQSEKSPAFETQIEKAA